jgi:hypothetical protein
MRSFSVLSFVFPIALGMGCGSFKKDTKAASEASSVGLKDPNIPAIQCKSPKSSKQLVTNFAQDLYGRSPTEAELKLADDPAFSYEKYVTEGLLKPESDNGVSKFVASLFRVSNLKATNLRDANEVALITDLKQEPVTLVLRNKDKPWSYFWNTKDVYCTERTAKLYDYPVFNTEGYVTCKLPEERSGFLGLVSVLRATSPENNPQAFYRTNNNYHRVAATLYFVKGIQLAAATNGPKGEGRPLPMADCVPTTDMRKSKDGLIFGTASVPLAGQACSGCHSNYNGPLSVAFRRFGTKGEILNLEDIPRIRGDEKAGISDNYLKAILAEQHSCWSAEDGAPPIPFVGLAGLADVVAESSTLGYALGIQIPTLLANVTPDPNMTGSIESSYKSGGETLSSAFRGFFLSESYKCAEK